MKTIYGSLLLSSSLLFSMDDQQKLFNDVNRGDQISVIAALRAQKFKATKSIDINAREKKCGHTPLIVAAYRNESWPITIVHCLLEGKADPNIPSSYRQHEEYPLAISARLGATNDVRFLLKNNASINQQDTEGYTALMKACTGRNSAEVVKILIENKADVSLRSFPDDQGKRHTAFSLAVENNSRSQCSILQELVKGITTVEDFNALKKGVRITQEDHCVPVLVEHFKMLKQKKSAPAEKIKSEQTVNAE